VSAPRSVPIAARPVVRRRTTAADPLKKVTLRLHARVAGAVRALVAAGEAPSADAFVEQAVVAALRERRRERLYAAYAEAATDPAFTADMDATARAFEVTLADGFAVEP
jgi:Arc/MetJ-type ribon-helix-helix transcriptional regulator